MAGFKVRFVHRPFGGSGYGVGIGLHSTPEIRDEAAFVVHRFDSRLSGTCQKNSQRTSERLNEVRHVAKASPHHRCSAALSSEIWKWRFHYSNPLHVAIATHATIDATASSSV